MSVASYERSSAAFRAGRRGLLSGQAPNVEHAARGVSVRVPLRERDLPVDHDRAIPVSTPAGQVRELHPVSDRYTRSPPPFGSHTKRRESAMTGLVPALGFPPI